MVELSRIAIVRNPRSGSAPDAAALARVGAIANVPVTVADAPAGGAFAPWVRRLAADFDVIVAAGGDGTVSTVAAAVARAGKTLAILPTGTLNHFARDAGIPFDLDAAAAVIAGGRARAVDIGVINDHVFLNNVSIGNYPRMVHDREALEERGHTRPVAAAMAIARTWWNLRKLTVALDIDGRRLIRRSPFIVAGNGEYLLSGLSLGTRPQISDGRLSLYVAPPTGRVGALALPLRAMIGTLDRYEQFETHTATMITAAFRHRRIGVAIDGEVCDLETPLHLTVRRGALRLLVPVDATPS